MFVPVNKQRSLIIALAALAAAASVYAFILKPAIERLDTLNRVLPEKYALLHQLQAKSTQYLALRTQLAGIEKQTAGQKDSEPLAALQSITDRLGIARSVAYMRKDLARLDSQRCEVIAELRLENITLKNIIDLMLEIKSAPCPMLPKSLYIEKSKANPNLLHIILQVSTIMPNAPLSAA